MDPFERAPEEEIGYEEWWQSRAFYGLAAQAVAGEFLQTFRDFPFPQKPASFNMEQALKQLEESQKQ
jgi:arylsulfatase